MISRLLLILSFMCLCQHISHAQQNLPSGILPDSIVITANRYPTVQRDVGQRITIWEASDIEALAVNSFDELLRSVGGVEVFSRTGFGIQSDITMRGSTFNGVLVLIDGMPLNDAQTGHFISDFPLPISQIKRVEILRGAASMIHGPDAIGGVIHIITETSAPTSLSPSFETTLSSTGGSHGLFDVAVDVAHRTDKWRIGGASIIQQTDGETITNQDGPVVGPNGTVRTDFFRMSHALFQTFQTPTITAFTRFGMDRRDFNAFHFYTVSPLDFSREQTDTFWGQLGIQGKATSSTQWNAQTVWKRHDDTFTFNPQFSTNRHTSQHLFTQFHLLHVLTDRWTLMAGLSGGVRSIRSNNLGDHNDEKAGLYVLSRSRVSDNLTLSAGTRVDYDSGFGTEVLPQANVAWTKGIWTLRANAGRSVRAPNYTERYINTTRPPQRDRNYGNPDLEAERAWSYEAGVDLYPSSKASFHVSAFRRQTANLIDFAQRAPSETPMLADSVLLALNIVEVDLQGIEVDATLDQPVGDALLSLDATYTRFHSSLEGVWPDAIFKYASGHARNLVQASSTLRLKGSSIGTQVLWKEKLDRSSYATVNLRFTYAIPIGSHSVTTLLDIRNLFDESYAEVLDAPMPGRWISLGARLHQR